MPGKFNLGKQGGGGNADKIWGERINLVASNLLLSKLLNTTIVFVTPPPLKKIKENKKFLRLTQERGDKNKTKKCYLELLKFTKFFYRGFTCVKPRIVVSSFLSDWCQATLVGQSVLFTTVPLLMGPTG